MQKSKLHFCRTCTYYNSDKEKCSSSYCILWAQEVLKNELLIRDFMSKFSKILEVLMAVHRSWFPVSSKAVCAKIEKILKDLS